MKKLNFDALTQFEVPESWIQRALDAKPKKKPLWLRPVVIGSAASLVITAAVVLTLWLHTGGSAPLSPKTELPVQPSAVAAGKTESTLQNESTAPTIPSATGSGTPDGGALTVASAAQAVTQAPATQPTVTSGAKPTQAAQPVTAKPTVPTQPVTTMPTQPVTTKPTVPTQPTTTAQPTQPTPPPLRITDLEYSPPPIDVENPGDATAPQRPVGERISLSYFDRFDGDEPIYCHISCGGTAVTSLYSADERMTVTAKQQCMAVYVMPSYFTELPYGTALEFIFYNSEGKAFRFQNVALTEYITFELIEW